MYIYIIYVHPILASTNVRDLRKSPKKKKSTNTSKDTHSRAKFTKSINQILLFHHFRAIFYPRRRQQRPQR